MGSSSQDKNDSHKTPRGVTKRPPLFSAAPCGLFTRPHSPPQQIHPGAVSAAAAATSLSELQLPPRHWWPPNKKCPKLIATPTDAKVWTLTPWTPKQPSEMPTSVATPSPPGRPPAPPPSPPEPSHTSSFHQILRNSCCAVLRNRKWRKSFWGLSTDPTSVQSPQQRLLSDLPPTSAVAALTEELADLAGCTKNWTTIRIGTQFSD